MLGLILAILAISSIVSSMIVLTLMVFAGQCSDIEAEYEAMNEQLRLLQSDTIAGQKNYAAPAPDLMISVVHRSIEQHPNRVKTQKLGVYTT